jgi:tetratricopeptide (TPR) repeat protein
MPISRFVSPLLLLAIWVATGVVYAQVIGFGFVSWDDPLYVTANSHVRQGLDAAGAAWALTAHDDSNWLPLTWLSHMLDVSLFRGWAGGHHFTNLMLHAIDTALLFALLLAATRERLASAFVAALFALHPLHVEVVAWISQRKELLSTGFGLLASIAYVAWVRRGGAWRYAVLLLAFAAALASKAMLVTLPFALLLLDYWPLARTRWSTRAPGAPAIPVSRLLLEKLPLFALSAAASAIAFASQQIARNQAPDIPLTLRLAHAAVAPFRYLGLALWPSPLSVLYPHPYARELGGEPWGGAAVAAAVAALVAISAVVLPARRRPYLAVGWLWFLGTLVPVIGLVQIGPQGMADRYSYVPLIGPFIALAWGARDAIAALGARPAVRVAAWSLAVAALAAAGAASHAHAQVWRDSESLYLASLAATPGNPVLLYNLGLLQARQGRTEEAARSYEAVLAIDPGHPAANTNLGNLRLRAGDTERAIEHYRTALRRTPDDVETLQNLGRVLAWRGELPEAVTRLEHAAEVAPGNPSLRRDLEAARAALEGGTASSLAQP